MVAMDKFIGLLIIVFFVSLAWFIYAFFSSSESGVSKFRWVMLACFACLFVVGYVTLSAGDVEVIFSILTNPKEMLIIGTSSPSFTPIGEVPEPKRNIDISVVAVLIFVVCYGIPYFFVSGEIVCRWKKANRLLREKWLSV